MSISGYTANYRLRKITYNSRGTHLDDWANLDLIDGLLFNLNGNAPFAGGAQVTGTGNAVVLDYTPNVAYTTGQQISFVATAANTGAVTVNCDGLGVKNLKNSDGTNLITGQITVGTYVRAVYNGTEFIIIQPAIALARPYVITSSTGAVAPTDADDFYVEVNATGGVSILTANATNGILNFGRPADPDAGRLLYNHTSERFEFYVGSTLRYTLDNSGNLNLVMGVVQENSKSVGDVLIASGTWSGVANVDIALPAGYRSFEIEFLDITVISTTSVFARFSIDNGSTYATTGYASTGVQLAATDPVPAGPTTDRVHGSVTNINNTSVDQNVVKYQIDIRSANNRVRVLGESRTGGAFSAHYIIDTTYDGGGTRPTHIRLLTGAGNFSGYYRLTARRN